jgi:hypothetical protein
MESFTSSIFSSSQKKMKLYPIETGNFKLDGGAMFGVVQKPFGAVPIHLMPII